MTIDRFMLDPDRDEDLEALADDDDLAVTIEAPGSGLPPVHTTLGNMATDADAKRLVREQVSRGLASAERARNLTLLDQPDPPDYEPPEGVDLSGLYPPDKREFAGAEFLPAEALDQLLRVLVARHERFTRFWPFMRVRCLWKAQGGAIGGKVTLGKVVKLTGLARYFAQHDAVIWLAADELNARSFTPYQVKALLFHELCHIGWEPKGGLYIRPHSYELHKADLEEYGPWLDDLEDLVETVSRLSLDGGDA